MTSPTECPFCALHAPDALYADDTVIVIRDRFPVSPGHTLVIPRRHVGSFFATTDREREALLKALDVARKKCDEEFQPAGYNIGINDGPAAGQTIPHLHVHLIPRYAGDQADPRGGVRRLFPDKAKYWTE